MNDFKSSIHYFSKDNLGFLREHGVNFRGSNILVEFNGFKKGKIEFFNIYIYISKTSRSSESEQNMVFDVS